MIVEFSVAPVGTGVSMSEQVARCLDLVDRSGLDYRLTPMGTIVEGDWEALLELIRRCHFAVREGAPRVLTTIRIDDRRDVEGALTAKTEAVERHLGRQLRRG